MSKLHHIVADDNGTHYGYAFWCPGCSEAHTIPTKPHERGWDFDGNEERPSFSPSILCHPAGRLYADGRLAEDGTHAVYMTPRCHSFVKAGSFQYLTDSTHALAGKTVDIPEWRGHDPKSYA